MDTFFNNQIISILPKLRIQAMALTRNHSAAEDLVQDAVCSALSAHRSFIPGSNFPAWIRRILLNRFLSNLRKRRDVTVLDDLPESALATQPTHECRLALEELDRAFSLLHANQQEALLMVAVHGMTHQQHAIAKGCAEGTVKTRVFRARQQLKARLMPDFE